MQKVKGLPTFPQTVKSTLLLHIMTWKLKSFLGPSQTKNHVHKKHTNTAKETCKFVVFAPNFRRKEETEFM